MKDSWLVSIILLNYNGKEFNKNCIDSILLQTYKNYEIIFVDNKSTDGSVEEIEDIFNKEINSWKIKIVKNEENLWFAWWNNVWVMNSSKEAKYIWLLNNDTVIDKNCLIELVKWLESNTQLWAVSSVILDKWHESQIRHMIESWKVSIMSIFWLQTRENAVIKNNVYYTNFSSWCSFLYKKSIVDLPFFDFYKIYAEDVQLSREIILKWYKLWVCKNSFVHHFWSATMNKMPYIKVYFDTRNLMLNYYAFLKKSSRVKLFIPCVVSHILKLIINRSNFTTCFKANRNSILWIIKNRKCIDTVSKRINNWRKISEKEFLSTMSYRLVANDDLHPNSLKQRIITIINFSNKLYYKMFNIIY